MISFDFTEWDRATQRLGAAIEQVPFALSVAMNDAAKKTRLALADETWPKHVEVRNRGFARNAIRVTQFAKKRDLTIVIGEREDSGDTILARHTYGGVKRPRGNKLAIPLKGSVRRNGRGVIPSQRPKAIIARTPKRALRVTDRGIFVGEKGKLRLKYSLQRQARQPADVPFERDFSTIMARELRASLPAAVARAMATRR